ncbi:hypothetical protein MRX96_009814 [Rhipicephalus microplus]
MCKKIDFFFRCDQTSALARLKGRRKRWYVFDQHSCSLDSYKNDLDAASRKPPLFSIDLRNAAISFLVDEENCFVIHSGAKEYVFVAGNHESMMAWVMALQANRDLCREQEPINSVQMEEDDVVKRKISLPHRKDSGTVISPLRCREANGGRNHYRRAPLRRVSHHGSTSDCESDSDAVDRSGAGRDCGGFSAAMWERIRFLRMASSESTKDSNRHQERAGSLSGNSVSSDSAIGHGDSVLSLRLHELEAELMATKCELAKALNRETSQKNTLIEQDNLIAELQHRLHCLEASGDDSRVQLFYCNLLNESSTGQAQGGNSMNVQRMNDKCCMLQSHNRFLNEEVQNLSRLLQQQQCHAITYQNCLQDQEKEIDQLKRDYVFLMQSAIRMRSMEGPEVMEVYFYGGQRHAARVLQLLREARMSNPGLPTYDSQSKVLQHTDALGFRHYYTEESLALHYICRQLHLHYQERLPSAAHHLWRWRQYLLLCGDNLISTKELKSLVRQGVPAAFRSQVWKALYTCRVADIIEDKGKNYYSNLCCQASESEVVSQNKRQISLDLLRTLPNNVRFSSPDADGIRKLQEVLQAICLHNPSLGYCQGMNFLVGMCLLFMEPEDAFWCLVGITERYFTAHYFDHSLVGAQADQEVLKTLLRDKLPRLHRHLAQLDIELCTVTLNWFLAIFFDSVPFEVFDYGTLYDVGKCCYCLCTCDCGAAPASIQVCHVALV